MCDQVIGPSRVIYRWSGGGRERCIAEQITRIDDHKGDKRRSVPIESTCPFPTELNRFIPESYLCRSPSLHILGRTTSSPLKSDLPRPFRTLLPIELIWSHSCVHPSEANWPDCPDLLPNELIHCSDRFYFRSFVHSNPPAVVISPHSIIIIIRHIYTK